ncbi:unnamed protein product [Pleuronectes platessa]|uniref:Uncharacterized protein n=1 Tax=Pleuronectes platessa TaxID=8262 RepID=A0A9N7YWS4_PLEPL|nr:unnamed protein product [Pleuronectes platessa]
MSPKLLRGRCRPRSGPSVMKSSSGQAYVWSHPVWLEALSNRFWSQRVSSDVQDLIVSSVLKSCPRLGVLIIPQQTWGQLNVVRGVLAAASFPAAKPERAK